MRRIGDHRAGDAGALAHERDAPGNRAAPIVAEDGELPDAQSIGELEHIADQLVGRIVFNALRP